MSGLLAASRVVSRAPGPERDAGQAPVGERLGEGRRHGLRQVAGPGELAVVRRRVDQHRLGLEHLLPEAHHPPGGLVAAGRPGLADVDHAPAQAVGPGRGEARAVGARQGVAAGEPVAQALGGGPGDHRGFHAADVRQERAGLKQWRATGR